MITVTVRLEPFLERVTWWEHAFPRLADIAIRETVTTGVELGAEHARQLHRYRDRTQALTASTRGFMVSDTEGVIEATMPYASSVEDGAEEHDIVPVAKRVLHWTDDDGEEHFAMAVNHPGNKPMPFIQPAADATGRYIESTLDTRLTALLRSMVRSG